MRHPRSVILDWHEQGHIADSSLPEALEVSGALPDSARWRWFLDRLFLFGGATMLSAGVIFFFAYNWSSLGRLAKFALAELPIAAALFLVWRNGVAALSGKAGLLAASLLTGALLALVGQTYQTGADTFELFAVWAFAILPWTLLARFPALWVFWLVLVNTALSLYFATIRSWGFIAFSSATLSWLLFSLNTVALIVWEIAALRLAWLRERWAARLLATAGAGLITALAIEAVFARDGRTWTLLVWLAWLGSAYAAYRRKLRDLYVLALGVLSIVVLTAALCIRGFARAEASGLLLTGLLVLGLSAVGGYWLKIVAREHTS